MSPITTRFAPSPTGLLHLGHAASAMFAAEQGDHLLLRIEDIDRSRCREDHVAAIFEDLAWLGLTWAPEVRRQSQHFADYGLALERLQAMELLYPCFCSRGDVAREIAAMGGAPQGPDGPLYPGSCRSLSLAEQQERILRGDAYALRLTTDRAAAMAGPLFWQDRGQGRQLARPQLLGDVVLARKDVRASYHLAVTLDDAIQGVTLVTRGADLFAASHLHRLLQALLDLPVPDWHHHPLVTDEQGRRLAKRDNAPSLQAMRRAGISADEVRRRCQFT